jgi:radical SAM superfamily enzyme YgiQ (UPF0313 family)
MRSTRRGGETDIDANKDPSGLSAFHPNSFWSFGAACEAAGARCPAPPLGLITLAALLPQTWEFRLINRNAEPLDDADILWADLVMTGGMLPQQVDTLAIVYRCKDLGIPVCVGGPDPTSSPHLYDAADFLVLGEAEGVIDAFVAAWTRGERKGIFRAEKFQADLSKSLVPRFDLLDFKHYLFVGIQFSRGCPFNCEFCDIIELYGRVPRTKTNEQMVAELDRLYTLGYRGHLDFVDDNLIGNKKALKRLLPVLKAWQQKNRYPFKFSTEASINLADDPELLMMMSEANFFAIFVGIESPDSDTLISTQKKQNARRSQEMRAPLRTSAPDCPLRKFAFSAATVTRLASCLLHLSIIVIRLPNEQFSFHLVQDV